MLAGDAGEAGWRRPGRACHNHTAPQLLHMMNIPGMKTPQPLAALLGAAALALAGCSSPSGGRGAAPGVQTEASRAASSPEAVRRRLMEGNERFAGGRPLARDLAAQRRAAATAQYPLAVVLGCMDSRVAPEFVFDQGIGDIFDVRVAGNVLDDDVLGSLEYACQVAGAKLVVVLGHSGCGAVKGACDGVRLGHLTGLLEKIGPAVAAVGAPTDTRSVAEANVRLVAGQILDRSPILAARVREGRLRVTGALYDLDTGRATFLD